VAVLATDAEDAEEGDSRHDRRRRTDCLDGELWPERSLLPWWPALLNTAMVTSAVRIGAAAKPVMKTGVVRCFRSSVRTRRIMFCFLPFR
jgi:hypothetical protein